MILGYFKRRHLDKRERANLTAQCQAMQERAKQAERELQDFAAETERTLTLVDELLELQDREEEIAVHDYEQWQPLRCGSFSGAFNERVHIPMPMPVAKIIAKPCRSFTTFECRGVALRHDMVIDEKEIILRGGSGPEAVRHLLEETRDKLEDAIIQALTDPISRARILRP